MIKIDLHKTLKSSNSTFELDVKMSVNKGDFIAIYGESGAGKTTILPPNSFFPLRASIYLLFAAFYNVCGFLTTVYPLTYLFY